MRLTHSCRSIAIAGHRGDRQPVEDALASEDPDLRFVALGAADRLNILDCKLLTTAFLDRDAKNRRRALELAARTACVSDERDELAQAVAGLLADPECCEVAAFTLGELEVTSTDVVNPLIRQATDHDDALARESAVAALGALGVGRAAVLQATGDVATVRRRAVISLANFDGPDVDAALERALDDRDWQVRQAAEDLLNP